MGNGGRGAAAPIALHSEPDGNGGDSWQRGRRSSVPSSSRDGSGSSRGREGQSSVHSYRLTQHSLFTKSTPNESAPNGTQKSDINRDLQSHGLCRSCSVLAPKPQLKLIFVLLIYSLKYLGYINGSCSSRPANSMYLSERS